MNNKFSGIMLGLFCIALCGPVFCSSSAISGEGGDCRLDREELGQIVGLVQRKKNLERALQKCGTDPVITYFYAYNLDRRGLYHEALNYYQLTLENDPGYYNALFGMAETYLALGDTTQAIRYYRKGLELNPENIRAQKRLREILAIHQQQLDENQGQIASTNSPSTGKSIDIRRWEYSRNIANRYGISIDDLEKAKQEMASLKKIAGRYDIKLDELIEADFKINLDGSKQETKGKKQVQTQNEYFKKIADRYGIRLDDLIESKNKMATLKNIARRYALSLDELLEANAAARQKKEPTVLQGTGKIPVKQESYLKDIAGRYGVDYKKIKKLNKKMADIRKVADQYGIQLEDLVEANRKSEARAAGKKTGKKERTQYLSELAKRYGVKIDKVNQLNQQISKLSKIASRYGLQLDELMKKTKGQESLFNDTDVMAQKGTHTMADNEYLGDIAARYGASISDLIQENEAIEDPHWIYPGQKVKNPKKK